MKKLIKRELYIVMHGQDRLFRIRKWIVISGILITIYKAFGWSGVYMFITSSIIFGLFVHFLFRYKTYGWTKPWWIMKKVIKTPFD